MKKILFRIRFALGKVEKTLISKSEKSGLLFKMRHFRTSFFAEKSKFQYSRNEQWGSSLRVLQYSRVLQTALVRGSCLFAALRNFNFSTKKFASETLFLKGHFLKIKKKVKLCGVSPPDKGVLKSLGGVVKETVESCCNAYLSCVFFLWVIIPSRFKIPLELNSVWH